jgi:hypothetical protein
LNWDRFILGGLGIGNLGLGIRGSLVKKLGDGRTDGGASRLALTVKASFDAPLGFNFGKPKGLDSTKDSAVGGQRSKKARYPINFLSSNVLRPSF